MLFALRGHGALQISDASLALLVISVRQGQLGVRELQLILQLSALNLEALLVIYSNLQLFEHLLISLVVVIKIHHLHPETLVFLREYFHSFALFIGVHFEHNLFLYKFVHLVLKLPFLFSPIIKLL